MTNEEATTTPSTKARILHISDLHFGGSFNEDSWTDLINHARTLSPNLVIVTGDLVDNPTRWSLARAANALNRVEEDLSCKVIVVPGNHDTRLWGLFPIRWINGLILMNLILFLTLYLLGLWAQFSPTIWLIAALIFAAIFASKSLFLDFNNRFKKFILQAPGVYTGFGLEIFAFDSATKSVFGARGRIPKKQFVDAQGRSLMISEGVEETKRDTLLPYRIAILHHHPLPIPYDDTTEFLMVADNAGAFLSEASKLGIRLVLHGHKHRSHFSRVTINAGEEKEHELAVLAVGTLSRSGKSDPPEHHFYFLQLDSFNNMEVTRYVAKKGGAFEKKGTSPIEPSNLAERRLHEAAVRSKGVKCDSNVLTAELTPDGDMNYRHEFLGFRVERENISVSGLPTNTDVEVGTGHIDDFSAGELEAGTQEQIRMVDEIKELTHRKGKVTFGRNITSQDPALNFYSGYVALNAFAMSVQQHKEMYSEPFPIEHLSLEMQPIPTEIFDFVVKFPQGFKISGEPKLLIEKNGKRDPASEQKFKRKVKYYPHLNIITARIPYPRLDLTYILQWTLIDEPPPSGNPSASLVGTVEALAQKLLQVTPADVEYQKLSILLKTIEEKVRKDFELDGQDPLEVSLMAYDKDDRVLKIVAANSDLDDNTRAFKLKYGDGIAGRAYKMNKGRLFIRKSAIEKKTPNYFYPADGKPCELRQIKEKVIISLPLRHPGNEDLIYGVLNLSSKNVGSRLQDIKEPRVLDDVSEFRKSVNLACYDALNQRIFTLAQVDSAPK